MRVGVIARADYTGLGIQSRNWVRLINPYKVIAINSAPFNNNAQHFEWYSTHQNVYRVDGFIKDIHIDQILDGVDVLLTFEIPYNYRLISRARERGIKTIIQNNWEFTDYLQQPGLPLPDLLVNHSMWNLDKQKELFPSITDYCPTPVFTDDYLKVFLDNIDREEKVVRFLHVAGRKTHEDRNGTKDLMRAILEIPPEIKFELVIKTQTAELGNISDSRIIIDTDSPADERDLYRGFDAMIMPRRYGGACMPMTEALMSGLPVIMTDIDPNNKILRPEWLVKASKQSDFMARTKIDVYSADKIDLAARIAQFAVLDKNMLQAYKLLAREIAVKNYGDESVKHKWDLLLNRIRV